MNSFSSLAVADACRQVGIKWNGDFVTAFEEVSEGTLDSFYFKSLGISDKHGFPYVIFYTNNILLKIPRSFVTFEDGTKYEIISDLGDVYQKLPFVTEGKDYKIKFIAPNGEIVNGLKSNLLKKGTFSMEWENERFVIEVSRLNFLLIAENK